MANKGKKFEDHFEDDFKASVTDAWLFRLKDQMSGYKTVSKNPCDYIAFKGSSLYLFEIKSIKGNTFSTDFRQLPLLQKEFNKHISGLHAGVVLWFRDHDKVVYIPISTFTKLIEDGKKSFNIKYLETNEYEHFDVPSEKLRTFMRSDYMKLLEYCEESVWH